MIWYDVAWLRDSIKEWINWFKVWSWDYVNMWKKLSEILSDVENYKKIAEPSLEYVKWLDSWEDKVKDLEKFILK